MTTNYTKLTGNISKAVFVLAIPAALFLGYKVNASERRAQHELDALRGCEYVVQRGDRIWNLAAKRIPDSNRYEMDQIMEKVSKLNPNKNLPALQPGEVIYLPCNSRN